jgi:hypothetical protein
VVLQDLSQDELEDPLLLLVVITLVPLVRTSVVVILVPLEQSLRMQVVHPQEVVESRAGLQILNRPVERGKVIVVILVVRVGNSGVFYGENGCGRQ